MSFLTWQFVQFVLLLYGALITFYRPPYSHFQPSIYNQSYISTSDNENFLPKKRAAIASAWITQVLFNNGLSLFSVEYYVSGISNLHISFITLVFQGASHYSPCGESMWIDAQNEITISHKEHKLGHKLDMHWREQLFESVSLVCVAVFNQLMSENSLSLFSPCFLLYKCTGRCWRQFIAEYLNLCVRNRTKLFLAEFVRTLLPDAAQMC